MNIEEKKVINEEAHLLCVSCKRFYGSEAFSNMCSQCFKKHQAVETPKKQEKRSKQPDSFKLIKEELKAEEEKKEVNKERCSTCNRKLKLLGVECKCGLFFCNHHRLPQDHSCSFNQKEAGKNKLTKQVIKVEKGKIESI